MNNPEIIKMQTEREELTTDVSHLMRCADFFPEITVRIDYIYKLIEGTARLKNEAPIKGLISTLQEAERSFKKAFEMLGNQTRTKQARVDDLSGKIPSNY